MRYLSDNSALLEALRSGHPGAAAMFYDEHAGHVFRTLHSILGADEDIPDLAQEVFLRALQGIGQLRDAERAKSWLDRIAVFVAGKRIRLRRRRAWMRLFFPEHARPTHCEHPPLDARRAPEQVYEVLDHLPTRERMAFTLRHIEGMTLGATAMACGTSLATLKRHLVRAEKRFLKAARERGGIEDWIRAGTTLKRSAREQSQSRRRPSSFRSW